MVPLFMPQEMRLSFVNTGTIPSKETALGRHETVVMVPLGQRRNSSWLTHILAALNNLACVYSLPFELMKDTSV